MAKKPEARYPTMKDYLRDFEGLRLQSLAQAASGNTGIQASLEIKNGIAKWSFTGLNAGKYNISAILTVIVITMSFVTAQAQLPDHILEGALIDGQTIIKTKNHDD